MLKGLNTNKLGGRKFIAFLMTMGFLIGIFIVMLFKEWLTGERCMTFVTVLPMIVGLFIGGNIIEKQILKGGGK